MLDIQYEKSFKRAFKRIIKRGYNPALLEKVVELLANEQSLPQEYRDHSLKGNYFGFRECHIASDWLLI